MCLWENITRKQAALESKDGINFNISHYFSIIKGPI